MIDLSQRIAELSPEKRELLRQQLKYRNGSSARPQITSHKRDSQAFPLSFAQQRLWFLDQMEPGSSTYNIPAALRLKGPLHLAALEQSFNEILRRHEALRTTFATVEGQPLQLISPPELFTLARIDLQQFPATEQEAQVKRLAVEEAEQPFNLAQGPLLRARLLQLDRQDHVLLLTMHHIVSDGWSMDIFFRELSVLYGALATGKIPILPEPAIQYVDFAVWQRQWLQGETLETQLSYWKNQLSGAPSVLELPTDRPRPAVQTYRGASQAIVISKTLSEKLKALSQQQGVTLFMLLLAAFKTLLYRYSGQEDIVIGAPIANRNRVEIEGLIGFFVNTLALRTDLSGNPSFRELLNRVREVTLGAYAHQDLPFEKLVEELQPERDLSHTPLFQVWFVLQNAPSQTPNLLNLNVNPLEVNADTAKFDLTLTLTNTEQGLLGILAYNTMLFDSVTIARMAGHFQTLLEGITVDPQQPISDLPLLTAAERQQRFSQSQRGRPTQTFIEFRKEEIEQSLADRFAQQVAKYPQNTAVKTKNYEWTYAALNRAANGIAQTILTRCGRQEGKITLLFEHDAPMIAGLLGVLQAGKSYVPLDPSYPQERLVYILKDSQASALLTNNLNLELAKELTNETIQLINLDELNLAEPVDPVNVPISPDTMAYLLYTSGSTGQPKGVMQNQRNVLQHIRNYTNNLHLSAEDRLTLLSSYSFDAAVMDIFGALLNGAALYPINIKEEGFANLSKQLIEQEITLYHSTPTVYRYFVTSLTADKTFPKLRLIVLGGEEVFKRDIDLYKKHFPPSCIFVNGLGPTESTVTLQYFINHDTELARNSVPVGYPVADTEVLLLNEAGKEAGVFGEIAIRSPYIALGYWQKPELTAASFLTDPEGGYKRIYRSGDMGRLRPDGTLEFVGRKDFQVKIRGFRIELKEIEAILSQHPTVQEAVVVVEEDQLGEKRLIAYIVPTQNRPVSATALHNFLKTKLPGYMTPSGFIILAALPLMPTGKIDRRALPTLDRASLQPERSFTTPRDKLELQLLQIWRQVLGVQAISVNDNFFELGGHSLLAVRLLAQIEQVLGQNLPLATLFQAPTIEQLAETLRQNNWSASWSSLVALQPHGSKPPFFCVPGNLGNVFVDLGNLAKQLGPDQPFYGLQDGIQNPAKIEALATHYLKEIRALQPEGPYLLGGVCSGSIVAFEMAQQLVDQGQKVALLALVEPSRPPLLGKRAYFNLISVLLWRAAKRFGYHSRNLWQRNSVEQTSYTHLKAKLVANMWAMVRYSPQKYPGRITLFLANETLAKFAHDPRSGWRELATQGIEIHGVPGSHNSLTYTHEAIPEESQIQVLAERLRACIDSILPLT